MWLGHSSFSTTANIYAHIDVDSKMEAANMIASKINLGELPEKKKSPKRKIAQEKNSVGRTCPPKPTENKSVLSVIWHKSGRQNGRQAEILSATQKIPKPLKGLGIRNAGDGGRTHTVSPPTDFESVSSANSNTPAHMLLVQYTTGLSKNQDLFCVDFYASNTLKIHP